MCELLAMSSSRPAEVGEYLAQLMPRGGKTGPHADGWGVAYYEGRAARVFKDPTPAAESRANTHPFEREWNGRSWVFAHNGKLPRLLEKGAAPDSRFQPLGETDSELAFCCILDAIAGGIGRDKYYSPTTLVDTIKAVVDELKAYGEFNFILSDGECLYVHAHTNLHWLRRTVVTGNGVSRMILLATAPLTAEPWRPLAPGSIHVYRQGEEIVGEREVAPSYYPRVSGAVRMGAAI